jgi:hypothetical protein
MKKKLTCVYCGVEAPVREMILSTIHRGKWCCRQPNLCMRRRMVWK